MGGPPDAATARALLEQARAARTRAYAPYSGFGVGAALLDSRGSTHPGVNVENASYGLTLCAERAAVMRAVADGVRNFTAIAVAGPEEGRPCLPCGACLQVLHEFNPEMWVVVDDPDTHARSIRLKDLLPAPFDADSLRT